MCRLTKRYSSSSLMAHSLEPLPAAAYNMPGGDSLSSQTYSKSKCLSHISDLATNEMDKPAAISARARHRLRVSAPAPRRAVWTYVSNMFWRIMLRARRRQGTGRLQVAAGPQLQMGAHALETRKCRWRWRIRHGAPPPSLADTRSARTRSVPPYALRT